MVRVRVHFLSICQCTNKSLIEFPKLHQSLLFCKTWNEQSQSHSELLPPHHSLCPELVLRPSFSTFFPGRKLSLPFPRVWTVEPHAYIPPKGLSHFILTHTWGCGTQRSHRQEFFVVTAGRDLATFASLEHARNLLGEEWEMSNENLMGGPEDSAATENLPWSYEELSSLPQIPGKKDKLGGACL